MRSVGGGGERCLGGGRGMGFVRCGGSSRMAVGRGK